jgi:hypothetical protein
MDDVGEVARIECLSLPSFIAIEAASIGWLAGCGRELVEGRPLGSYGNAHKLDISAVMIREAGNVLGQGTETMHAARIMITNVQHGDGRVRP